MCFTSLVRPILEYVISLWNPANKNLILQIEGVQMRATKNILGNCKVYYRDRLTCLNLLRLTYRREYLDSVFNKMI